MKKLFVALFLLFITFVAASETINDGEELILLGNQVPVYSASERLCDIFALSLATSPLIVCICITLFAVVYRLDALTFVSSALTLAMLLFTGILCSGQEVFEARRRAFSCRQL